MSALFRGACWGIAALALALGARELRAADPGPHGNLSPESGSSCVPCHSAVAPRHFDIGRLSRIQVPSGGKRRLADPISRFCWVCHRAGNPYGARPLDGRALAAPGHGMTPGKATVPDAWAIVQPPSGPTVNSRIEEAGTGNVTCTTCHDIHGSGNPLFLRKSTPGGDYTELCSSCHPGRENAGLTGRRNIVVRAGLPYSTHPAARTGTPPGTASKAARCADCHDVHRAPESDGRPVAGLLRGAPGETASELCRRCHAFPAPGNRESHPMEAPAPGRLPPESFVSPEGLPAAWRAGQHFDSGAAAVHLRKGEAPRCTSCHDLHGGLPMTSLLYGPDIGSQQGGDWCFSCHPREALLSFGHPGDDGLAPGGDCAGCHGIPREGSPSRWGAHRGFRAVRAADPSGEAGDGAGSTVPALDSPTVSAIVEALQDGEPAVREQAFEVLFGLRPGLDPGVLRPAARDPRPDVRAKAARVVGALGDRRGGDILLPLAADREAQVRAAAAWALARVGEPRAAEVLLPLLADHAPEVRRSAVPAFETLRDPRAIPALVALLFDPEPDIGTRAMQVLAGMNDARVLDTMLAAGQQRPAPLPFLTGILERMSDPAALDAILTLLDNDNRIIRAAAAGALIRYSQPQAADGLVRALQDQDVDVISAAAISLIRQNDPRAVSLLTGVLLNRDVHPASRRSIAKILVEIDAASVVAPLIEALADANTGVREQANATLDRLTCRNFGTDQVRWREWWDAQPPGFPLGRCR